MSSESINFEKVCIGTRKIIKLRFENPKEVPCEWYYHYKPDPTVRETKDVEKFSVYPETGHLLPG
jgi:hypothetical protein